MPSSVTSAFSIGKQSAKGSVATKYFTTLATVSGLSVVSEREEDVIEHPGSSSNPRATTKRSESEIVGYTVPYKASFLLRPNFIGAALIGAGFTVTTVGVPTTPNRYEHTFVMSASDAYAWMTALEAHGSGSAAFETKAQNSRLKTLSINAERKAIQCELAGIGLVEGDTPASPTKTAEVSNKLLPTIGTMSATFGGASFTSRVRTLNVEIANEFDEEDQALWETARFDLPVNGAGITGSIGGIDLDFDTYKRVSRGSSSATSPNGVALTGPLSFEYRSAANISAPAAVPYKLAFSFPKVEFFLDGEAFEANGQDQVRFDLQYAMVDSSGSEPVTILLVNNIPSYAH